MAARDPNLPDDDATIVSREPLNATTPVAVVRVGSSAGARMAMESFAEGTVVADRYEIVKLLGEGGMGSVYKAKDRATDRFVALKTIRPEFAASEDMLARFKQELILARQVTHRNVVRIYDIGESDGVKFITMEFVEGEDLRTVLDNSGKLSPAEAVEIVEQVCRALEAAHAEGVIHRDLKPQNIMREHTGRIVVMDFGLARVSDSSMTQTGALVGTMEYMSPEQALGNHVDTRSDIFAIGVIFYELLSGKSPYRSESAIASLVKRTQQRAVPVSEIENNIPRAVSDIVSKCLERDCSQRYQAVTEVLNDLEAWHGGSKPQASRIAVLPYIGGRKKYYYVGGALLSVLVIASGIALRSTFFHKTAPAAVESAPAVSLAIVPFRNASGDPSIDWLGASVAEMLGTNLGQSAQVRTVSSGRIQQILQDLRLGASTNLDPDTLRRLASFSNADVVISGQFVKPGGQLRLDLTLQDFKHARSVPLKAEAASDKDLIVAMDRLAKSVRENLSLPESDARDQAASLKASSDSVDALRDYAEGQALRRQGRNLEAVRKFEDATRADPKFALAFSSLGDTYSALGHGDQARDAARRAVDLSQQLPAQERYAIEGNYARIINNPAKAIDSYEHLANLLPNDVDVLFRLGGLYEQSGAFDKAIAAYTKVLARDPKYVDALLACGRAEINAGKPQDSLDYLNRAFSLAVQVNNDEEKATILHSLGMAYQGLNKLDDALLNFQQSLEIKRRLGDTRGVASSLNQVAQIQDRQGKSDAALASYQSAIQTFRKIGDKADLSMILINLGWFYQQRGRYQDAMPPFKEALQIGLELNNENAQALALNNIGGLSILTGRYGDAQTYLQQALQVREKLNVPAEIAEANNNLAEVSLRLGDFDKALPYYLRALDIYRRAGDKSGIAIASYNLGTLFDLQGRFGAALASDTDALKIAREQGDRSFLADELAGYGQALTLLGRFDDAQKSLDEALALAREIKSSSLIAQALNFQGERLFYAGDYKQARAPYEAALKEASSKRGTAESYVILLIKLDLAKLSVREGRAQAAIPMLRGISRDARAQWLKYVAASCSLYLGEALLDTKDYAGAHTQLEDALRAGQDMNLRTLTLQSHYLLAKLLRQTGAGNDAANHEAQARQMLDEIRKEAGTDDILKRSDLAVIHTESSLALAK